MSFCKVTNYEDLLLLDARKLEGLIRDFITYQRHERKLAPSTVSSYLSPIAHFYEMNDVTIKWKKLKKFKAKHKTVVEDRPYTREEIKTLVNAAPLLRDKVVILVMATAGLRRGAIEYLRVRDLQRIDKYNLYKISVYKKEEEQYTTFCTPECSRYIDQYLEWRKRLGERLQPNSPLIRIVFDPITQINRPKAASGNVVAKMVHTLLDNTGIRTPILGEPNQRFELMQCHGFRKFFKTTCINGGMNPLYSEYLMGHRSGLTKSYFKPTDTELLEGNDKALGYVAVIPNLTIYSTEEENRKLKQQLAESKTHHTEEWELMRIQVAKIMKKMNIRYK